MKVREEFYVDLRGRKYPVYAGVLIAATESGLKSLTVEHIQLPCEENGHMAVMKARAEFEDGRVFVDYGDCSPRSTSPQIAVAAVRMASTRAKGRVLRDAIGLGETLKEELPDDDEMASARHPAGAAGNGQAAVRAPQSPAGAAAGTARRDAPAAAGGGGGEEPVCLYPGCGAVISKNEAVRSQHHFKLDLCKVCFPKFEAERKTAAAQG